MSVCSPSSELPDAYHRCSPTQRSEQKNKITHSLLKSCYMDRSVKSKLSVQNGLTSLVSSLDVWKDFYKDVLHLLVLWF